MDQLLPKYTERTQWGPFYRKRLGRFSIEAGPFDSAEDLLPALLKPPPYWDIG
jgi:hypothetical protein